MKIVRVSIAIIFSSLTIPLFMFLLFSLSQTFTNNFSVVTKSSRFLLFLAFPLIVITFSRGSCESCHEDFERVIFPHTPSTYHQFINGKNQQGLSCHGDSEEEGYNDNYHNHSNGYGIIGYVNEVCSDHDEDDGGGLMDTEDFEHKKEYDDEEDESCTDFEKRAEEFIAKVNKQWREEILSERLLLLTGA